MRTFFVLPIVATNLLGVSQSALAQTAAAEGLEEIVVTAERRSENLQRTAVAVSVLQGNDMLKEGKATVEQMLENVPSVSIQRATTPGSVVSDSPASLISIRGVQSNGYIGGSRASMVPSVAAYVDGVYNGLGSTYDLERVEVLRGPQGTLYGRSATAGVINFHAADPRLDGIGGSATVELGNYNLQHFTGSFNLPLSDTLALRVAADKNSREGYDTAEGGKVDVTNARAKLLYKPNESFSGLIGFAYEKNDQNTGGKAAYLSGTGTDDVVFSADVPVGYSNTKSYQVWGEFNLDLGAATLTYVPAFRSFKQEANALDKPAPTVDAISTIDVPTNDFLTQELRITSNATDPLSWQAGVFYYDNNLKQAGRSTVYGGPFGATGQVLSDVAGGRRDSTNLGIFAEGTYSLTSNTRLTAGLRWDYTKVVTTQRTCLGPTNALVCDTLDPEDGTNIWRNVTYKLRLEHDLTPANLLYASVSTAFLPGDVAVTMDSNSSPTAPVKAPYDAETLTAFEIGSKNRFMDERLQLNADIFYYRYGGKQLAAQVASLANAVPIVTPVSIPARMRGAELEILFQPTTADRFGLNMSYVDAYFVDKPAQVVSAVANDEMAFVIPWIISPSYSHTFTLPNGHELTPSLEGIYRSGFLVTNYAQSYVTNVEPYLHNGDTLVANVNLNWTFGDRYSLTGYVRNATDERYKTYINLSSTTPTSNKGDLSAPRTFGVVGSVRF